MQRRDFIRFASITIAASMAELRAANLAGSSPALAGAKKVLVVGAGISGLATASALVAKGFDVVVLEARNRIGGRIWTQGRWADAPVDLGASWIHGITNNPITDLATKAGAKTRMTSYSSATDYDTDGTLVDATTKADAKAWSDDIASVLAAAQNDSKDYSVRAVIERDERWSSLSAYDQALINYVVNDTLEQEYAGSADELSAYYFDSMGEFAGNDVVFPNGYRAITDYLAQGLNIQLNQVARQIDWSSTGATVTTQSSSFKADHVVVTLPLGVLQSGAVKFSPALPTAKSTAIGKLGMGTFNKCYLRFSKVFWPDTDWLTYIPDVANRGQWEEWFNMARVSGKPVLLGFNAAKFGRDIESWSDADIVADAMATLRTMFGNSITDPQDAQITRWSSDPFARGSYSFNKLGSTPAMRDTLAASLSGRLHFAGEATHKNYFATVHGAYLSGLRAAKAITG